MNKIYETLKLKCSIWSIGGRIDYLKREFIGPSSVPSELAYIEMTTGVFIDNEVQDEIGLLFSRKSELESRLYELNQGISQ
ncbi:MAG TPA: hypothetical protein ENH46_04260 [Candidatus Pacearchaeota archaeon]|nr:hypothetical protein [Candidatus Pacearchaeota archaeon]